MGKISLLNCYDSLTHTRSDIELIRLWLAEKSLFTFACGELEWRRHPELTLKTQRGGKETALPPAPPEVGSTLERNGRAPSPAALLRFGLLFGD